MTILLSISATSGLRAQALEPQPSRGSLLLSAIEGLDRIAKTADGKVELDALWNRLHDLRGQFPGYIAGPYTQLRGKMLTLPELSRFGASALVLQSLPRREIKLRAEAGTVMRQIARKSANAELKRAAVEVLAEHGDPDSLEDYAAIQSVLRSSGDDYQLVLSCTRALWLLNNDDSELAPMRTLLESDRLDVRAEAAMTLAEIIGSDERIDSATRARVEHILRQLEYEPGSRGQRARLLRRSKNHGTPRDSNGLLIRIRELEEKLKEASGASGAVPNPGSTRAPGATTDTLRHLMQLLRRKYVEPSRLDEKKLFATAVRALIEDIDPHARLIGAGDLELGGAQATGQYLGLGARFGKPHPDGPLVVLEPIYGGPAYNVNRPFSDRLLAGDQILEINGVETQTLGLAQIRRLLSSQSPGDVVFLGIQRGKLEARTLIIPFGAVEVRSVHGELIAPKTAYIRLRHFGENASREFETKFDDLQLAAGGLRGLIVDLRNNRGGLLRQAVNIVDLFVAPSEDELPIVTEVRLDGTLTKVYEATASQRIDCPVILLVNQSTASSAEVLAGSLRCFGRATLVGRRTYGKGVSQEIVPLPADVAKLIGANAGILIPTHYLVLPDGTRFHRSPRGSSRREGGLEPDLIVDQFEDELDELQREEFRRIQYSIELNAYLHEHLDHITELAGDGDWPTSEFDNFDGLYDALVQNLGIHLSPHQVLRALRQQLERFLEDRAGKELPRDPRGDRQLQAALEKLTNR